MASTPPPSTALSSIGPVPFKDVAGAGGEGHRGVPPPEEFSGTVAAMPTTNMLGFKLHRHQDTWVVDACLTGVLSVQRRFAPRPGDVVLASPPKCGTTWLKALAFAVMARAAYPPSLASNEEHPLLRLNPHACVPFLEELFTVGQEAKLELLPSPRLINTHMHHSLLPPSLTGNPDCKIVYVCREPKDMVVSLWHFAKSIMPEGSKHTFSDLFEDACKGETPSGPIWDHTLGYWRASKAHPDRVLFLKYEEMLLDRAGAVRELARFLGVPFSAAEEAQGMPADIVGLCSIETMKGLSANRTGVAGLLGFKHESFFRKGVAGDWANHMTLEMARRFDDIVEDKLRGSGLTFKP
ncbi:cytosolic sulfotransferase 5 [Brachypodium distachyon]|uniref:Sulfotransferase n=1 Tax=Brachypodium distachyon TaxID=15368 RepID=I1HX24_BRADI|nr:cytosolic sulfotransferase 5 [Brachypodium distachyon]KQJ93252.1 hypothetical protein BRADI_3g03460v3 [Brachypodium distachyon]|eukprot:XP_003570907.1 cytosolic sulfotransferase 5 [Brachypodium distachyon]